MWKNLFLLVLLSFLNLTIGFNPNLFAQRRNLESKTVDEVKCDNQLNLFNKALSARDQWALRCKFLKLIDEFR